MSVIRFMFEGRMEQEALPRLLAPLFANRSVRSEWSGRYEGRDQVIKSIPKLARARCTRDGDVHIFALVDFHPKHPRWRTAAELQKAVLKTVDRHLQSFVHLHLAMHDIESWILCDRNRIVGKLGIPEDQLNQNVEKIDLDAPPKVVVRRLFRQSRREYREMAEGVELLSSLNIGRVYNRCRYFKTFLDDLSTTAGIELEPILRIDQ